MTTAVARFPGLASDSSGLVDDGGFTLIELLMVVVIVGLLASIAIPQFNGVRQKAYLRPPKSAGLRARVVGRSLAS